MEYYRNAQLAKQLAVSKSTVWNWSRKGLLPKPIKIGLRTTVWRKDQVDEAISKMEEDAAAALAAEQDSAEALAAEQEQPESTPQASRYQKERGSKRKAVA